MKFLEKMAHRRRHDAELERTLKIPKNAPTHYSPADIEALEEERVPWLKMKRARRG